MCTPSLAVDAVVVYAEEELLLIHRRVRLRGDAGSLAVVGGFVDVGESVEAAVVRETREETGLEVDPRPWAGGADGRGGDDGTFVADGGGGGGGGGGGARGGGGGGDLEALTVMSDPTRDPRRHTVSVGYVVHVKDRASFRGARAGDDAKDVAFLSIDELEREWVREGKLSNMAFDHGRVVEKYLDRRRRRRAGAEREGKRRLQAAAHPAKGVE